MENFGWTSANKSWLKILLIFQARWSLIWNFKRFRMNVWLESWSKKYLWTMMRVLLQQVTNEFNLGSVGCELVRLMSLRQPPKKMSYFSDCCCAFSSSLHHCFPSLVSAWFGFTRYFPELRQKKKSSLSLSFYRKVLPSYWNDIAFTLLRDVLRHNCCNVSVEWDKRTLHGTALFFHTTVECCCCHFTPEHKSEVIIFLKPGKCSMMCSISKRVWE